MAFKTESWMIITGLFSECRECNDINYFSVKSFDFCIKYTHKMIIGLQNGMPNDHHRSLFRVYRISWHQVFSYKVVWFLHRIFWHKMVIRIQNGILNDQNSGRNREWSSQVSFQRAHLKKKHELWLFRIPFWIPITISSLISSETGCTCRREHVLKKIHRSLLRMQKQQVEWLRTSKSTLQKKLLQDGVES